jgi:hypothetical protein
LPSPTLELPDPNYQEFRSDHELGKPRKKKRTNKKKAEKKT